MVVEMIFMTIAEIGIFSKGCDPVGLVHQESIA